MILKHQSRSGLSTPVVYHRGRFCDAAGFSVPVLDRGFLFGDGVFETLRTYARKPFHLEAHLARLRRSAAALGIGVDVPDATLVQVVHDGIERIVAGEVSVRVLVTRGVSSTGYSPALAYALPAEPRPELYAFFSPLAPRAPEVLDRGVRVLTIVEEKSARFSNVKLMNGVPSILALDVARKAGAYEVLRLDRGQRVLEGFISNVFARHGDALRTPPIADGVLDGVTRTTVIELARERGLRVEESSLPLSDALAADELFLTHTSAGVVPVVAVDDRTIGSGRPGEVARTLAAWFDDMGDPKL